MEAKMNKRRKYDRDFKRNAVLLCAEPGRTVTEVAENLGAANDLLYRWRREYHLSNGKPAFPGNGIEALIDEQKKLLNLELNKRVTLMRDNLKQNANYEIAYYKYFL